MNFETTQIPYACALLLACVGAFSTLQSEEPKKPFVFTLVFVGVAALIAIVGYLAFVTRIEGAEFGDAWVAEHLARIHFRVPLAYGGLLLAPTLVALVAFLRSRGAPWTSESEKLANASFRERRLVYKWLIYGVVGVFVFVVAFVLSWAGKSP